jgi:hypothetical protein
MLVSTLVFIQLFFTYKYNLLFYALLLMIVIYAGPGKLHIKFPL